MAVFRANEVNDQLLDWTILRDGGIALYWRTEILAGVLSWLESKGYQTVSFETSEWISEEQMHDSLKANLSFPAYYGNNLDALDECVQEDLAIPDLGGLVLVLNRYDHFAESVPGGKEGQRSTAEIVLDIFARAVRYHMLFGHRLIILVQSDDPRMQFGRLGGIAASWNCREWLHKDRGI
jgi:RNAse (barnase) inhibitor barstar